MSESLTSRVGRLVAGSFHALVDAVENAAPESIMEQAIREIDSATAEVRVDLGLVEAQRHLTSKRLAEESKRHDELSEQASLALQQDREDLASAAIERQIDIEAQLPILESRLVELAEDKVRLEGYVGALLARKREMRDALDEFRQAHATSPAQGAGRSAGAQSAQARAENATNAFDRIFQRRSGLPGRPVVAAKSAAQLAELEDLARRNRVQERLARLKAGS